MNYVLNEKKDYSLLVKDIESILLTGKRKAIFAVNRALIETYWAVGKKIVIFEQKGKSHAEYGTSLLLKISSDLKAKGISGFSRSNLQYMRLFFVLYSNCQTLSGKLSWSHYLELLEIESNLERGFYEKQCENSNWSVRELRRQIDSNLFYRLALSKNKKTVLKLAQKGELVKSPKDLIREPYVLEFLGLKEDSNFSEKKLEDKIISNLQKFILELGKGFTFVSRQHRISFGNKHYYVDLVFYHRVLKCFVLIDLKIGELNHSDVGQMNLYLNYFKKEENSPQDNAPIGIILCAKRNTVLAEYALGGLTNRLLTAKYKLYLPKKGELEQEVKRLLK